MQSENRGYDALVCRFANLLIGFMVFFCLNPLSAQVFYKAYGISTVNEGGQALVKLPDGNIAIGGYKGDSAMVTKMDVSGNVIWVRTFKPNSIGPNLIESISVTPDNYIIGVGDGLSSNGLNFLSFYFKIDLSGNIQWLKKQIGSESVFHKRIWAKNSSEYLMYGGVYEIYSANSADVIVSRVDAATGAITWTSPKLNYIPSPAYVDDLYSSTLGKASVSYATGRIYINGSNGDGMRSYITKFDSQGNHVWSKYLMHSFSQSARVYGIDIIYDNDSLVVAYFGDVNGASSSFTVGLIKTDTLGNIGWTKNYQINSSSTEISYKVLKGTNGYFLTGYKGTAPRDFFILSVTNNGNLVWANSYGTSADEALKRTTTNNADLVNGEIMFTGAVTSGTNTDMIVAAVNEDGSAASCINTFSLSVTVTNNPTNVTVCTINTLAHTLSYEDGMSAESSFTSVCPEVFLGNDTAICSSIVLNANVGTSATYLWSDGSTGSTLTVSAEGTYWVTVQSGCCTTSDTIVISQIQSNPSFVANVTACDTVVSFTNTSTGSSTFQWLLGDGASSTNPNPVHTYNGSGIYSVTLITNPGLICADSTTMIIQVGSGITHAVFNVDQFDCNDSISLINNSTQAITNSWDFGDGQTSNSANPTHVYDSIGTYTITLITSSSAGCTDTASVSITFNDLTIEAEFNGPTTECTGEFQFMNNSINADAFLWDFGDQTTLDTSSNPQHFYQSAGTYQVMLITFNTLCNTSDTAFATVNVLSYPQLNLPADTVLCNSDSLVLTVNDNGNSIQWNTGDTTYSIIVNESGSYWVVADNGYCYSADTVNVWFSPQINLGNDTLICSPLQLNAVFAGADSYLWSDGSTGATLTVSSEGTYWVVVQAGDCILSDTITIGLDTIPPSFVPNFNSCSMQVDFANTTTGNAQFLWMFGDTTFSTDQNPAHTYNSIGSYNVSLISNPGMLCADTIEMPVTVGSDVTLANFALNQFDCNDSIVCTSTSVQAATYLWDFGDGQQSSQEDPDHTYSGVGPFNITLITTSSAGCSDTITQSLSFDDLWPDAEFNVPQIIFAGPVQFQNTSVNTDVYTWDFGDQTTTVSQQNPQHDYAPGTYTITLIAENNFCNTLDSMVNVITVLPVPDAILPDDTVLCNVTSIVLNVNSGSNAVTWSNGSNASSITVHQSGEYWVSLDNGYCFDTDTIDIEFFRNIDLGNDTTFCEGDTLALYIDQEGNYLWSNGSADSAIVITTSGLYWVQVSEGSCFDSDSVNVIVTAAPVIDLGNDSVFCKTYPDSAIILNAGSQQGAVYLWNTFDTTSSITINEIGTYWVMVKYGTHCFSTDTITFDAQSGIDLEDSLSLCGKESVVLKPLKGRFNTATYVWSTGSNDSEITVSDAGFYWVEVGKGSCLYFDTIEVTGSINDGALFVPNAFTPGKNDNLNSVFYGVGDAILDFHMMIFNRWGQKIFESNDINNGWDGTYKGEPVLMDSYVWIIDYTPHCDNQGSVRKSGVVNLIR